MTVTIACKLSKNDSPTGLDIWKTTVINDCKTSLKTVRTIQNNTIMVANSHIILIPFGNGYVPYNEWKEQYEDLDKFTIRTGDYIFLGNVVTEQITANNILALKKQYGDACVEVKSVQVVDKFGATKYQIKIEGV